MALENFCGTKKNPSPFTFSLFTHSYAFPLCSFFLFTFSFFTHSYAFPLFSFFLLTLQPSVSTE
ncbi:hypothetical protein IC582_021425 [Cucumis melo]